MGDIGSRQVRYEVLPSAPAPRRVDRVDPVAVEHVAPDPQPATVRTERARS